MTFGILTSLRLLFSLDILIGWERFGLLIIPHESFRAGLVLNFGSAHSNYCSTVDSHKFGCSIFSIGLVLLLLPGVTIFRDAVLRRADELGVVAEDTFDDGAGVVDREPDADAR